MALEIEDMKSEVSRRDPGTEDLPPGEGSIGISLIDLAEILDQHKIWVESGGESGAKADLSGVNLAKADLTGVNLQGAHLHRTNLVGADLSMANLRGASLVRADLRNANLLGTELRGANLMGANAYGVDGLWFGRLGGTNLFDAVLPESISAVDSSKAIGDATKVARVFYFLTVGVSLICCLLIAFTTDVRLLLNSSVLPIARLGNLLPMTGLYLGGPLVLLVLSTVLAYWIVPVTLFFFWVRYLARQDFRGTLLHVFLITASVASATCLPFVVSRVLRPGDLRLPKSKNILRLVLRTLRASLAVGCILFLLSIGVNRGLPYDRSAGPNDSAGDMRRWASLVFQSIGYRPYSDLTEATLSSPPPRGAAWTEETVERISGARLNQMNLRFARGYKAFLINAKLWRANLEGAYLSEADLRGANLRETLLRSAVLDRAQVGHAVLVSANATGANFSGADLRDADLSYGTFENAVLSNVRASRASLYAVNLRNSQLLRTDLSRTDMRDTKLERAVLSFANLEQADLSSAKLFEANLTGAQLRGASGITAQQVCSASHGRAALMDPDLATEVQLRCAASQ